MSEVGHEKIMEVRNLCVSFPIKKGMFGRVTGYIKAVENVSFDVFRGEVLGLVGESGCGKTTLIRAMLRMNKPNAGTITYHAEGKTYDIRTADKKQMKEIHKQVRMVFQDPDSSLVPSMTAMDLVAEPLRINKVYKDKKELKNKVQELFEQVGLKKEHMNRYINMFSGGQKQRIGVARALALNPKLILADEPTSALDVSVQAQVINLLMKMKKQMDLSMVFVSHDLGIVQHVSDRIAVMYLGNIVELATREQIANNPLHPYTDILFGSVPQADPSIKIKHNKMIGDIPSVVNKPQGCSFHTRCPYCQDICKTEKPELRDMGAGHLAACHLSGTIDFTVE